MPCNPPSHSPSTLIAPPVAPPPLFFPTPVCPAPQHYTEGTSTAMPTTSYRERLRAGGRGAFQRAIDKGLMPKAMREMGGATQTAGGFDVATLPQQQGTQNNFAAMQCGTLAEGQQMWNGAGQMQTNESWHVPMNPSQSPPQSPYGQYGHQPQHPTQMSPMQYPQMPSPAPVQMMVQMPVQQPQLQQMLVQQPQQMTQCEQLLQMTQSYESQTPAPQLLPEMAMHQVQVPGLAASGDSTPTDIDRCMAIVMPQASQFPCDNHFMAAQLQAAADCQQCYED